MTQLTQRTSNRTSKGKSLLSFYDAYCVVAIETTDFDYGQGEIIEIASKKYRNHQCVDSFHYHIKPTSPISSYIEDLTGITNECVSKSPSLSQVFPLFLDFIDKDILITNQANRTINFLYDACTQVFHQPLINDYVDIHRLSRYLMTIIENHQLDTPMRSLVFPVQTHHPIDNVVIIQEMYSTLRNLGIPLLTKHVIAPSNLDASSESVNSDNYFLNKNVVFTGKLDGFTRNAASQILVKLGANIQYGVTKRTGILILGTSRYQNDTNGGKSNKHRRAEQLIEQGKSVEIMCEDTFLRLANYK
ncbi:hypothetical protein AOC36_04495 [Erysipelothrix larvae]|uniref:Exonuclease domain-containing protein n=1 Tax=Erysipelothrix larvae TaxID=1514105 RepID=A0A109UGW9_9FIRM|nr:exonuclease domain-containing protein [Erysipelothrix larvae]AMC93256.1 hypothetical protein AOC36_04495 [Erysipelothrix larvae]